MDNLGVFDLLVRESQQRGEEVSDEILLKAANNLELVPYIYIILKRPDIIWKVYTRKQLLTCDDRQCRALARREMKLE